MNHIEIESTAAELLNICRNIIKHVLRCRAPRLIGFRCAAPFERMFNKCYKYYAALPLQILCDSGFRIIF